MSGTMKKLSKTGWILFIIIFINSPMKSQSSIGLFDQSSDIGKVKYKGTAVYDVDKDQYTLTGSGRNIWDHSDEFQFLYKKAEGDFTLYTLLKWISKGVAQHRKAGIMIRESLDPGSPYVSASFHGDGLVAMQFRLEKDSATKEIRANSGFLSALQLERIGDSILMFASDASNPLQKIGQVALKFKQKEIYIGLFVCSHDVDVVEEAAFMNTRLSFPIHAGFIPYKDYIGSRLELLTIKSGLRKVLYESNIPFEAPNWSRDGKFLVVNRRGYLYRIETNGNKLVLINTGFADTNNNDHGFSPDGRLIAISHSPKDVPVEHSLIYIVPSSGGIPKLITNNGPSYWHGWSPDGRYLVYTARRNNSLNIYRIPAIGGEEIALTENSFLDDGPDYSTDGKYIWFNSNRSGSMEIWRMNEDGANQKQITNDDYQNWFPHQSPDGKWLVFLSYLPEVNLWEHPFYKHVMVRIMKPDGSGLRVLTHLYGGQGTINVPSWSPDSKMIAFVSNSDKIED
jgi:TolB protein